MTPLTKDARASSHAKFFALCLALVLLIPGLLAGCVTSPAPVEDQTPSQMEPSSGEEVPKVLALPLFHRIPPAGSGFTFELPEPGFFSPIPTEASLEPAGSSSPVPQDQAGPAEVVFPSVDITVLSRLPESPVLAIPMPEPVLPVLPPPPAPPPVVPVPRVPEARGQIVPPAPPSPPVASTPSRIPAEEPKPETVPKPSAPQAASSVQPVPPASSARSVEAVPAAIPETRVEVMRGQRFELRLRGSGWTFLGDEQGREGVRYETRRFEDNHAVFVLNPSQTGEYLLRFQRQNPLELRTESSLVRLVVTPATSGTAQTAGPSPMPGFVIATAGSPTPVTTAPGASPPIAAATGTAREPSPPGGQGGSSGAPAAVQTAPASVPAPTTAPLVAGRTDSPSSSPAASVAAASTAPVRDASASQGPISQDTQAGSQVTAQPVGAAISDPAALIKLARDELSARRVSGALEALDRYRSLFPNLNDEVFYLYALAYEQDTPFRDIKRAYEHYRRVRDDFPRSQFWRQASDRIAYLERHFPSLR